MKMRTFPTRQLAKQRTFTLPFVWLIGLMLSFAHERPILILSSMDRINPRLFDIMVIIGIALVWPLLPKRTRLPREFYIWSSIVFIFLLCAIIYFMFLLPDKYGKYSIFFAAKYVQGLIAIYIALKIPLTARQKLIVQWSIIAGGVYVGIYCIFQYLNTGAESVTEIAPGKFVRYYQQVLTGPLSYSYFHLAQFSSLCAIVALAMVENVKGTASRWCVLALAAFISWPLFFSGSRTGLGLMIISMVIGIMLLRGTKSRFAFALLFVGIFFHINASFLDFDVLRQSTTFERLVGSEGGENSVANRLQLAFKFDMDQYKWSSIMLLVGGGFYVAPVMYNAGELYRVDYGIHNTFLFPLEQGGALAAVAFLYFLYAVLTKLYRVANRHKGVDRALAVAVLSYLLASLPAYMAGQIFWMGFGSGHFNTCIVLVILLALRETRAAPTPVHQKRRTRGLRRPPLVEQVGGELGVRR